MSSVGQGVGMVVGGIIGFFAGGNVMLGASIGGAIGGYLDPPKGPKIEGPRLTDTKQQTSTYGAFITRTYANVDVSGNIFWIENNSLKEVSKTESQGGKGGGGGAETTTYSYYGTFALGLCACDIGEVKQLGRIWIGGKLFNDPFLTAAASIDDPVEYSVYALLHGGLFGVLSATAASADSRGTFTFHNGASNQAADPRMQAALGINDVPAYRGLCYIVFNDLPLKDYGNSIVGTQIKVEVLTGAEVADPVLIGAFSSAPGEMVYETGIISIGGDSVLASGLWMNDTWDAATVKTRQDFRIAGMFSPVSLPTTPATTQLNFTFPGKYPWLAYPIYYLGGGTGFGYAGAAYPFSISVSPSGVRDWCVSEQGMMFVLYDDGYLYVSSPGIAGGRVYLGTDAWTMYFYGGIFYVLGSGTTWIVDSDLSILATLSNSLDMQWGSGDSYSWMAFGGSDQRIWLMECYGVGNSTVARLNPAATAIDESFNIAEASTDGGRAAIFVKNDILIRAYVDGAADKMTVEQWILNRQATSSVPLSEIVSRECLRSGLLTEDDIDVTALTQDVRGYKISSTGSIRSALEPLQACWPFDVVPSGYKIKFVPRGGSSVATIDSMELAASDGEADGVRITHAREMATQLPRRVEVTYLDANREYDIGPAGLAERLNTDATGVEKLELPIVLTAAEAQAKAQTLLYLRWLERHTLSFVMPPTRLNIEVSDVVTITAPGATHTCRLTETTTLPDGRIEVKARPASTTIYTAPAVAQDGLSVGQVLTWAGPSSATLLDIPCVLDDMDQSGFVTGMSGTSASWPGGTLVRTDDGSNWTSLLAFTKPGITVGFVSGTIGSGRTDIPDTVNVIQAYFTSGEPTSATEAAIDGGANLFAYGVDQRWEIISVRTVADRSDGGKSLSNLLRGRYGTEWAMTLHQDGDALVLLDTATAQFLTQNLDTIGLARTYRAITSGKTIDSGTNQQFTYRGMNLECLAPIGLNGHRDVGNLNWTLKWVRRGRIGTVWRDYVDVPLGESSESYVFEIWSDSSYTTLKRTLTATTPTVTYTYAQQIADFGVEAATIYAKIYQVSANVGNGIPLVSSITRAVAPTEDYLFAYVGSLLHFNGANDSTIFTDQKSKTWTRAGTPLIKTAQSLFGGASGYFTGAQNITTPSHADFQFGSGNFCIEFATYFTTAPGSSGNPMAILRKWATAGQQCFDVWFYYTGDENTEFRFTYSTTGSDSSNFTSNTSTDGWSVATNSWQRWALFRYANTLYFTLGGVVKKSWSMTATIFSGTSPVEFGTYNGLSGAVFYAEELRITKDNRYTGAYTPIAAPFSDA